MVAWYTVNTLAASTRLSQRYILPPYSRTRRTERSAHAQHAPDGVPPRGTQTTHSTPSRDDGVERTRSRAGIGSPQTQPGSQRAEAGSGAKQRRLAPRCARRSDARFGSPRCALRASLERLKRSRPVGERKPAAPKAACQAAARERSLAEVVRDGAFGGRTLARALPRSYDRAWVRRAGAPAPYHLRRPPWAAAAQTARLAFANAAEDGRARSEPESA